MSPANNIKSSFLSYLIKNNRPYMDGFQRWLFQPGMLFNSLEQWWGTQGPRAVAHEGLDLYSFADAQGIIKIVDRHIKIPAAFAGKIIKIDQDFLGKSIFISHQIFSAGGRQLYSIYGHTAPLEALHPGKIVAEGEIIAAVSGAPPQKPTISPHLHLSFAWIPAAIHADQLNWPNLNHDPAITLIDPLSCLAEPAMENDS
jgi:hypothetical protein